MSPCPKIYVADVMVLGLVKCTLAAPAESRRNVDIVVSGGRNKIAYRCCIDTVALSINGRPSWHWRL